MDNWMQEIEINRAKFSYLEVQHTLILKEMGDVAEYKYTGGSTVAIGKHHLLTALHVLRPAEEWLGDEYEASQMKILQVDPTFDLGDQMSHETERWKGNEEFNLETFSEYLDIALISSK